MSQIIEAKAIISGEDRLSKVIDGVNKKLSQVGKGARISSEIDRLNKSLGTTKGQLEALGRYQSAKAKLDSAKLGLSGPQAQLDAIRAKLDAARKAAAPYDGIKSFAKGGAIAQEIGAVRGAVKALEREETAAARAVQTGTQAMERQAGAVREARRALNDFGAPVSNMVAHERALKENVDRTTAAIRAQEREQRQLQRNAELRALTRQRRQEAVERIALDRPEAVRGRRRARPEGRPEDRSQAPHKPERNLGPLAGAFGAYEAASAYKDAAAFDRRITMIGQTADASRAEIDGLGASVHDLAQQTATPVDKLAGGLEALVAQGRNLRESMEFLPSVAKTAAASGSEVEDIAKTADSVGTNFEIAGRQMQKAFDIMAAGGKAGQFELKDMARYLPSLGPAASAIGFKGEKGLSDLVAMLQVMRKGSGTAEEAVSSMNNILAKMESDKTKKGFKELGVDAEAAFKKARIEGRNLVEVFEELVNKALKGDRSRLGEIIDDMEFKRGVQALMSYRGEWQKLSQTLRDTSGGTVARDLVQVTKDAQAGLDRLTNSWKRFTQAGSRLADAGGVGSGLGDLGKEMESVAQALERLNKAYSDGGFFHAFKKILDDIGDRLKDNDKAWLKSRQDQETGRISELEAAKEAHRKKLVAEGRPEAEINDAMRIRDAEIAKALRRKGAVAQAQANPALADKVPLRMGSDPLAPIQGKPSPVGPGVAGFQEAYPLDLYSRKPFPVVSPLPPQRPESLPRTIGGIDEVLSPGGPTGPGTFSGPQPAPLPPPPARPLDFGGRTIPVEVVSLPAQDRAADLKPKDIGAAGKQPPMDFGGRTIPVEVVSLPRQEQLDSANVESGLNKRITPDQRLEAIIAPGSITAEVKTMPPVSGTATVTVDNHHEVTVKLDSDMLRATMRSEAKKVMATVPLSSSGARTGAVSMPGAAAPAGGR